jgi:hypothetical protein
MHKHQIDRNMQIRISKLPFDYLSCKCQAQPRVSAAQMHVMANNGSFSSKRNTVSGRRTDNLDNSVSLPRENPRCIAILIKLNICKCSTGGMCFAVSMQQALLLACRSFVLALCSFQISAFFVFKESCTAGKRAETFDNPESLT